MATIGELANVPEPGAAVASQWAQDATNRIRHRFINKAALDAWTTAIGGTEAVTIDNYARYQRVAGGWARLTDYVEQVAGAAFNLSSAGPGPWSLAMITIPADAGPRYVSVSCHLQIEHSLQYSPIQVDLMTDATVHAYTLFPFVSGALESTQHVDINVHGCYQPPGAAMVCQSRVSAPQGAATFQTFNDYRINRLDVHAYPAIRSS